MKSEILSLLLVSGASLLNILLTFYISNKRVKPEIEKMAADRMERYAEAGESLATGAQVSSELLLDRIIEIKQERDNWRSYSNILRHQLKALDVEPIPFDTDELVKKTKRKRT